MLKYKTKQIEEITLLNTAVFPALKGLVISSHVSNDHTIIFTTCRQTTLALATHLKLSSIFKASSPIDCHVVDTVKDKFRFTVIYNVHNSRRTLPMGYRTIKHPPIKNFTVGGFGVLRRRGTAKQNIHDKFHKLYLRRKCQYLF